MMKQGSSNNGSEWSSHDLPGIYRIVVSGKLSSTWWGRLGGMKVTVHESSGGASTVLEGLIRDRAELAGIINTLNDLHMTLLRVEVVEDES